MKNLNLKRRSFIAGAFVVSAGVYFGMQNREKKVYVYANKIQVLLQASYHLLPPSSLGPGAKSLHIANYFSFILADARVTKNDKDFILNGSRWLEEDAYKTYEKSFLSLSFEEKDDLFKQVAKEEWGETYIYDVLSYCLEAFLSAPIYGSNTDEMGWKWLDHNPGFPQPKTLKDITYEV